MGDHIDINCDMGEGFPFDAEIMPFVSSANIACGGHAGDAATIGKTIALCIRHGVAPGAHPSFPDIENFGRAVMGISHDDLARSIRQQIALFKAVAAASGTSMHHIKLHGALYNLSAVDQELSEVILEVLDVFKAQVLLYGLSGSLFNRLAREKGFRVMDEVFADRTYQPDGSLTPRSMPGATISDERQVVRQVLSLIRDGSTMAWSGEAVSVRADTVCIHGDGPQAVAFATLMHQALTERNIRIQPPIR
jgi:UPF0271 protein